VWEVSRLFLARSFGGEGGYDKGGNCIYIHWQMQMVGVKGWKGS